MSAETTALPSKMALDELTTRLELVNRFVESHGNSAGYVDESLVICQSMVKAAGQLRDTLAARKGTNQPLSLDALRETLSGTSLLSVVAEYDRAIENLENEIFDQVHEKEAASEAPDVDGRDALDRLSVVHLALHNCMRQLVGAAVIA